MDMQDLAAAVTASDQGARLRIAVITALEGSGLNRVRTGATGDTWVARNQDVTFSVGQRVVLLQQGPIAVALARVG
jgi:hypothetical protein